MARRSGVLAELQRQIKASQRRTEMAQRATAKEHAAAVRQAEQARKAEERVRAAAARASEADRKRLEKEAKAAHVAAMEADVEERNTELAEVYDEIDSILHATLDVDDYVDLDELRRVVTHPPFDRTDLETAAPPPVLLEAPSKPKFAPPDAPSGVFGKKRKLAELTAAAESAHRTDHEAWRVEVESIPDKNRTAAEKHSTAEAQRVMALEQAQRQYQAECEQRDAEVAAHNTQIDALVTNLGYGTAEAIQDYISIVLSNSIYPDHFDVAHDFSFESDTAELRLQVSVPNPDTIPAIKAYKYTKSTDEITTTALSQKACKDRYLEAVHLVSLRSLHEVFEADRRGLIKTISLEVGTEGNDPATGRHTYIPFVAVAAERESFLSFDLSGVVAEATLAHLGASMSKNPFGLVAADTSGIRRS